MLLFAKYISKETLPEEGSFFFQDQSHYMYVTEWRWEKQEVCFPSPSVLKFLLLV